MPWANRNDSPKPSERAIGGFCYLTFGLVGLLYIIISGRQNQSNFFRFHFLQSIVLGIIGLLLSWTTQILLNLLMGLLRMLAQVAEPAAITISQVLGISIDVITKALLLLPVYGMIFAFLGKYAEIPFISNLVRRQM